jgi:hypothetical protein
MFLFWQEFRIYVVRANYPDIRIHFFVIFKV